ncbi:acyl-CoA carboxylase epsilon subunit [Actinopolyspora halophila]|uniref:acyl-CoA carboxylase epsilon subunit n=1 Tax=Actinopolyspora halophila TaxID=1850 RepID=UPI003CCC3A2A
MERGSPDSAELAALVAVLGRITSADRKCDSPERARPTAPWVAAEKGTEFAVPRSWKRQRN